jgi:branched-subunit amino acid transport protein
MNIWVIIIIGGLLTFATRLWFRRGLRFVPVAVLSAIILPELTSPNGTLVLSWRNPELLAGLVAILVAWKTKNVLLTILAGMAALVIIQLLFGHFGI